MKKSKYVLCAVFAVIMIVCSVLPAFAKSEYPKPTDKFFVNDFADCISDEDEANMQQLGEQLYYDTKAQVVVVTVDSLNGDSIENYSIGLAREWEIGEKDKNTGVLLLMSKGDRQIRIEVGYGLEGRLTDGKTGRIIDNYAIPYLKENNYSKGLLESYKVLVEEVYAEFGVEGHTEISTENQTAEESSGSKIMNLTAAVIFIIIILMTILRSRSHNSGADFHGGPGGSLGGGGFSGGDFGGGGFSGGGGSFGGGGSSSGF